MEKRWGKVNLVQSSDHLRSKDFNQLIHSWVFTPLLQGFTNTTVSYQDPLQTPFPLGVLKRGLGERGRGAGAGPAGTAAAGPMLEAKLMNLIKGWLQKF